MTLKSCPKRGTWVEIILAKKWGITWLQGCSQMIRLLIESFRFCGRICLFILATKNLCKQINKKMVVFNPWKSRSKFHQMNSKNNIRKINSCRFQWYIICSTSVWHFLVERVTEHHVTTAKISCFVGTVPLLFNPDLH